MPNGVLSADDTDSWLSVTLTVDFEDYGSVNNVRARVCKFHDGQPSAFSDDIHFYFRNFFAWWGDYSGVLSTTGLLCSNWVQLYTSPSQEGDMLGGYVRIISPGDYVSHWESAEYCSGNEMQTGVGMCWSMAPGNLERTCK